MHDISRDRQQLQAHGQGISEAIAHVVPDMKAKALVPLYGPMLLLLQVFSADALQLLQPPLVKILQLVVTTGVCTCLTLSLPSPAVEQTVRMHIAHWLWGHTWHCIWLDILQEELMLRTKGATRFARLLLHCQYVVLANITGADGAAGGADAAHQGRDALRAPAAALPGVSAALFRRRRGHDRRRRVRRRATPALAGHLGPRPVRRDLSLIHISEPTRPY